MIQVSRKNELTLSELPVDVLEIIVRKATWQDVISLRQVSRNLRSTVDNMSFVYKKADIIIQKHTMTLTIDGQSEEYENLRNKNSYFDSFDSFQENIRILFYDLKSFSNHPKTIIEYLNVDTGPLDIFEDLSEEYYYGFYRMSHDMWTYLTANLKFRKTDISVKSVRIGASSFFVENFMSILKPSVLESIETVEDAYGYLSSAKDQLMSAKSLKYTGRLSVYELEQFYHFERMELHLNEIHSDMLIDMKKEALKSNKIQKWESTWSLKWNQKKFDEIEKELGNFVRKESNVPNQRLYCIEHDGKTLQLTMTPTSFDIEIVH